MSTNKGGERQKPEKTPLHLLRNPKTYPVAKQFITASLAIAFLSVNTSAQSVQEEDTSSAKHLAEVVVTGSRTEKRLEDVGRSVTVISSNDIKGSGANSVAEVLSMAEGIYITGTGQNFGANQSLFMRGANSNQSVILIDGIAVSDPTTPANALDLSELSLSEVDRIEIVRGSHSTLYGSSAIGGVVNIVTSGKQKQGLNINATGTAGSFGEGTSLVSERIGMNYTCKGGFYSSVDLSSMNMNGLDATIDTTTVAGMPRDKDGMNRFDYGGKLGYKSNKVDIFISRKTIEKSSDIDDREFDDDDNYTLDFTRNLLSYGVSYRVDSGFVVSLSGGKSSMRRVSHNDSSLTDNLGNYDQSYYRGEYTGTSLANELQMQFSRKGYSVVLGGGMNDQTMSQNIYGYSYGFTWTSDLDTLDLSSRTNSFFLLADLNGSLVSEKAKAFSLSLGARSNKNNTFGSSLTWQVNPMVKVSSTSSVYANFSTGYNAPSLYQLHSPDKEFTSSISRGNVNLRPETSLTQEFGVYQKLSSHTGVRIGFYNTEVNDVVEYVYLWDKNTPVSSLTYLDYRGDTYLNLGKLTTQGVELEAHGAISSKVTLAGNFSFMRGQMDFDPADIDTVKTEGNYVQLYNTGKFLTDTLRAKGLTRRPVMGSVSLTYAPTEKVFFKAVVRSVSKRNDVYYDSALGPYGALGKTPVEAYTLFDLVSGAKFNNGLSALVRIENIMNTEYSEIRGFSSRGRGIFFTLNYTF